MSVFFIEMTQPSRPHNPIVIGEALWESYPEGFLRILEIERIRR